MFVIEPISERTRDAAVALVSDSWGSEMLWSKGKLHSARELPGFTAIQDGELKGLVTYCIDNGECEIVSLDSRVANQGLGTQLIEKVIDEAKRQLCSRVWLITTNANTRAIRFYQRRGFNLAAVRLNAMDEARKIKPQ
ncbi:MAG TPA: GNAT family N-acetyltransferase, partial [Longilinea sp.]|nr:GNAT family N-acetyltransferase [Longilinea sp.]